MNPHNKTTDRIMERVAAFERIRSRRQLVFRSAVMVVLGIAVTFGILWALYTAYTFGSLAFLELFFEDIETIRDNFPMAMETFVMELPLEWIFGIIVFAGILAAYRIATVKSGKLAQKRLKEVEKIIGSDHNGRIRTR